MAKNGYGYPGAYYDKRSAQEDTGDYGGGMLMYQGAANARSGVYGAPAESYGFPGYGDQSVHYLHRREAEADGPGGHHHGAHHGTHHAVHAAPHQCFQCLTNMETAADRARCDRICRQSVVGWPS